MRFKRNGSLKSEDDFAERKQHRFPLGFAEVLLQGNKASHFPGEGSKIFAENRALRRGPRDSAEGAASLRASRRRSENPHPTLKGIATYSYHPIFGPSPGEVKIPIPP